MIIRQLISLICICKWIDLNKYWITKYTHQIFYNIWR